MMPLLQIGEVWHVGDMRPESKRSGSLEGAGLSVSVHPAAWRRIARGFVDGDTWLLQNERGTFLNALALTDRQRATVLEWGVREGLAEAVPMWRWTYRDDELDETCYQHFVTLAEAEREAEDCDDEPDISEIPGGYVSTPLLDLKAMQNSPAVGASMVLDLLLPLYCAQLPDVHGVWWSERLDPQRYSAPRGVISPELLADWRRTRCDGDPDADMH